MVGIGRPDRFTARPRRMPTMRPLPSIARRILVGIVRRGAPWARTISIAVMPTA
jgi:hypothetical protein